MKILNIIPTQIEMKPFLFSFEKKGYLLKPINIGKCPSIEISSLNVCFSSGGLGKVQFGVQTQYLIDHGNWDFIICIGAAGTLNDELSVGDVIIGIETIEHDIKRGFNKILMPRFQSSEKLISLCKDSLLMQFDFKIVFQPIASGDEDICDPLQKSILHTKTGAFAAAWEGVGGARACKFNEIPFIEIRAITDNANCETEMDFKNNLEKAMVNLGNVIETIAIFNKKTTANKALNTDLHRPV